MKKQKNYLAKMQASNKKIKNHVFLGNHLEEEISINAKRNIEYVYCLIIYY